MLKKLKHPKALTYLGMGIIAIMFLAIVGGRFLVDNKPAEIRKLHDDIAELQEKLISAEITSSRLREVQKLVAENMSYSGPLSDQRQSTLPFLRALTKVLDNLGIVLVALEPKELKREGRFLVSPYHLEILGNYEQFGKLVSKMEKSPRLISVRGFEVENQGGGNRGLGPDICQIGMEITTLTLVKEAEWN